MSDIEKLILSKQKCVCILGMGRSGTSMTTRVINLMGVFLGKTEDMMPADKDVNAEGYWEHVKIVQIHDEILNKFNSSWESTTPLPDKWWELPKIKQYKDRLIKLIKNEFRDYSIWGFKDPRTCVLLPLWKEIFDSLGIEPMFVIPMRNPIDIANSLKKRDGLLVNYSMRIWYYHMINILEDTKNYSRIFIKYDDMLENADLNLKELTKFLSIDVSEENKERIKGSLKPNLRHSKTKEEELQLVGCRQVVDLYNICMNFIQDPYSEIDLKWHSSEMYSLYGELMEVQYADKKMDMYITSLFIDYGMGYSEETSIKQKFTINESMEFNLHFELGEKGENIKNFRWDLLEGVFCKCVVDNISVNNAIIKIENSNADYSNENEFDFLTIDPMCFWKNNFNVVESVSICGKINFYEYYQLQKFYEDSKGKIIRSNEKLNYYENENGLLIKNREQIIFENENNRSAREKEVMKTIDELEDKYKILLENKIKVDEKLQSILNSSSWKITKSLRRIKQIFTK